MFIKCLISTKKKITITKDFIDKQIEAINTNTINNISFLQTF